MVKVICKNCNYKGESKNFSECPYCGKNTLEKEKNAEEILEEVSRILERQF